MADHETLDVLTRYLALELKKLDDLYIAQKLSTADYMQIGILLRVLEAVDKLNRQLEDLLKYK